MTEMTMTLDAEELDVINVAIGYELWRLSNAQSSCEMMAALPDWSGGQQSDHKEHIARLELKRAACMRAGAKVSELIAEARRASGLASDPLLFDCASKKG